MMVMNPFLADNRERIKDYLRYAINSESSLDDLTNSDGAVRDFEQVYPDSGMRLLKKRGTKMKSIISVSMPSLHSQAQSDTLKAVSGEFGLVKTRSSELAHNDDIENLFNFLGKSLQKLEVDIVDRHSPSPGSSPVSKKEVLEGLSDSFFLMKRLIEGSQYADAETKRKNSTFMGRIGKFGKMFAAANATLPTLYDTIH
jgi:hypothetical protein